MSFKTKNCFLNKEVLFDFQTVSERPEVQAAASKLQVTSTVNIKVLKVKRTGNVWIHIRF